MCNRRSSTGHTQDTGFSLSKVASIAAHELGHIFNMKHDDDGMYVHCVFLYLQCAVSTSEQGGFPPPITYLIIADNISLSIKIMTIPNYVEMGY